MIRYILREIYYGHVIHAGGYPEIKITTIDGDQDKVESYLRFEQFGCPSEDYVRELLSIELIDEE